MAKVAAEVGTTANQYQILAKLASGGMAEIFLARGASVAGVERYCVLKRILRERASDAEFVQMFVHEARLVAQLQHPNIASVYDIGMLGDSYFFTMEYVHGETIRSLLLRAQALHRPLPLASVLTIIAGAAAGLHHAHERNSNDGRPLGIVHRDVSPSNLMVSYEGNVKVVDFGVAKAEDCRVETRSGTVKGKISYLSPEQCRGARVDRRSDVFSLGIVLWEMLTGERLYRRDSDFDNMTAIVHEATPPPSTCRSDLPSAIDDLVARMLAKSPSDRIQTAAEVVDAIEAASMDAGTILSTSAVSRLVRELFGVRAVPWLELDGDAASPEPSTVESRPIPPDLGRGPSDAVGARIAGALDPILSRLVAERRAISMPSALAVKPQSERVTEVAAPGELPPSTSSAVPADLTNGAELEAASAPSGTGTCTTVLAPPGGLLAHSAPPEDPIAASAASPVVNGALASTANATGSPLALGQDRAVITSSSPATAPGGSVAPASRVARRLVARRLVAVTVVASALGVIPILRAMPPAPDPPPAGNTSSAAAPPPDAAARTLDANGAPATSPPRELTPSDAAHAVDPTYAAATPPVRDAPAAQRAAPPDASIHEPGPHTAAPPPRPAAIDAGAARQVPPDAALIDPVQPAPVPPETVAPPALELVSRLFRNGDHAMVVHICSAAPLSRDIADICVMAACQQRDAALAARWLPFCPARRDQLVAFCKEHGAADIGNTLDCTANPLDCR